MRKTSISYAMEYTMKMFYQHVQLITLVKYFTECV